MFSGKKTYMVVAGGLLAVVAQFLQGDIAVAEAINQALMLLGVGGLRMGVAKDAKK